METEVNSLHAYFSNMYTFAFLLPCRNCNCSTIGSIDHACDVTTGQCNCKANANGLRCDTCKADSFNLNAGNPQGCQKCFCYAHGTACVSAPGFTSDLTSSPRYKIIQSRFLGRICSVVRRTILLVRQYLLPLKTDHPGSFLLQVT